MQKRHVHEMVLCRRLQDALGYLHEQTTGYAYIWLNNFAGRLVSENLTPTEVTNKSVLDEMPMLTGVGQYILVNGTSLRSPESLE